jgi:hypothetical protein
MRLKITSFRLCAVMVRLLYSLTYIALFCVEILFVDGFCFRFKAKLYSGPHKLPTTKGVKSVKSRLLNNFGEGNVKIAISQPTPGFPIVKKIDEENKVALISIALSGTTTQAAFAKSCASFNEVK